MAAARISASILKTFRTTHRVIGAFTAPALIFFALSGTLQTFSLHETTKGSAYKPAAWIVAMSRIHKKQTLYVAPKKTAAAKLDPPAPDPPASVPRAPNPLPLKIFFGLVGVGLLISTLTGVVMSYKFTRHKLVFATLLLLGIVIPLLLLPR